MSSARRLMLAHSCSVGVGVGGAGHAFFDWKPDDRTKATFKQYGVYYADAMRAFFISTLY